MCVIVLIGFFFTVIIYFINILYVFKLALAGVAQWIKSQPLPIPVRAHA